MRSTVELTFPTYTDFRAWQAANCRQCARYRPSPALAPNADNCPLAEALVDYVLVGDVPTPLVRAYGATITDATATLPPRCARFTTDAEAAA